MNNRNIITICVTVIVIILLIIFLGGPETILANLEKVSPIIFLITAIIFIIDIILRAVRWEILLKAHKVQNISLKILILPMFSSSFLNLITPARAGEAVRLFVLKNERDVRYAVGVSVIIVEQIVNLCSLLLIGFISLILILTSNINFAYNQGSTITDVKELAQDLLPIIALLYFIGIIAVLMLFFVDTRKFMSILRKLPLPIVILDKLSSFLDTFAIGAQNLRKNPIYFVAALSVSSTIWITEGIMLWLFTLPLINPHFQLQIALFASTMGNLTFIFPILPGSIGTYEIVVGVILALSPLTTSNAVLVAGVDRAIKTVTLFVLGGVATVMLHAAHLKRKEILLEAKNKVPSPVAKTETLL